MLSDRPCGDNYAEFLPWWQWAVENLNRLIAPNDDWKNDEETKSGVLNLLWEAREKYQNGKESGVLHLAHLINLAEDLNDLQESAPEIFDQFKATLASSRTEQPGYLTGKWFEVRSAWLLTEAGIDYTMPDPPDFLIDNSKIGVECYGPRLEEGGNIYRKILSAISDKERKYHGENWFEDRPSVLMIDATWLVRARREKVKAHNESIPNILLRELQQTVDESRFNLVIAFIFGHDIDRYSDERAISCVHAPKDVEKGEVSRFKRKLLNEFFPQDDAELRLPNLPK